MQKYLHKFQHLKIPLEDIKSATENFNTDKCIGVGGYGKVYKGEVSHYKGRSIVAIKRLGSSSGQGVPEFLKEITTLSRYSHENLISLQGFCYEGEEMILVYNYASHGSLDRYLNSPHLTWSQRIKICLDAAKGISYLHDPGESYERLIHCDIKSANILLDHTWNARVSDLGLSIMGSANEQQSLIVTLAAGTHGYCDPEYVMTHTLTKESDIYSFGVVLFEVLCGALCYTCGNGSTNILVPMWIESYKQRKLNDIIFKIPTQSLDQMTLEIFSDIAYRCLNESREDRPMMTEVIAELKTALKTQEVIERMQLSDYEEMTRSAEPPLNYSSPYELWKLLMKGVLLNDGKAWFSLNNKGEHCEMISIAECLDADTHEFQSADNSRFAVGPYRLHPWEKCKVGVKTQFLSPGITYTVDLMLRKTESLRDQWVSLKYKLEGETETLNSNLVYESDDGYWWALELYQFTSDQRDHEIVFEFEAETGIEVEGIVFRPVEEVEHTTDDANWEEKLPTFYEDIMKESKHSLQWSTKKEAYSILCKGFLTNLGDEEAWFSIDNDGRICFLRSSRNVFGCISPYGIFQPSPASRFGEVLACDYKIPDIVALFGDDEEVPDGTLDVYLVYKFPEDLEIKDPVLVRDDEINKKWEDRENKTRYIYLVCPETPVIGPKADQNTHNRMSRLNIKGLPRQRDDGWMEVCALEQKDTGPIYLSFSGTIKELIVEGLEWKFTKNVLGTQQQ